MRLTSQGAFAPLCWGGGQIYALYASDGTVAWAAPASANGPVRSSPAVHPTTGIVYVGSDDSYVYAINGTTGVQVWRSATGGKVVSSPVLSSSGTQVFVGSDDFKVCAMIIPSFLYGSARVERPPGSGFRFDARRPKGVPSCRIEFVPHAQEC